MDNIKMSFTVEELSVIVEVMNSAKPPAGRRRAVTFFQIRAELQIALATALEEEAYGT